MNYWMIISDVVILSLNIGTIAIYFYFRKQAEQEKYKNRIETGPYMIYMALPVVSLLVYILLRGAGEPLITIYIVNVFTFLFTCIGLAEFAGEIVLEEERIEKESKIEN